MKWFRYGYGPIDDFAVGQDEYWFAFCIPPLKWGISLHFRTAHYSEHSINHYKYFGKVTPVPKRKIYITWSDKDPAKYNLRTLWEEK